VLTCRWCEGGRHRNYKPCDEYSGIVSRCLIPPNGLHRARISQSRFRKIVERRKRDASGMCSQCTKGLFALECTICYSMSCDDREHSRRTVDSDILVRHFKGYSPAKPTMIVMVVTADFTTAAYASSVMKSVSLTTDNTYTDFLQSRQRDGRV
jgi:hypothetical protein